MGIENRKDLRRFVRQPAMMVNRDGSILGSCTMLDVSASGAKLQPRAPVEVPDDFILVLSKNGHVLRQCRLVWRSEAAIGVQFVAARSKSYDRP
jgi:hypothetical protein